MKDKQHTTLYGLSMYLPDGPDETILIKQFAYPVMKINHTGSIQCVLELDHKTHMASVDATTFTLRNLSQVNQRCLHSYECAFLDLGNGYTHDGRTFEDMYGYIMFVFDKIARKRGFDLDSDEVRFITAHDINVGHCNCGEC